MVGVESRQVSRRMDITASDKFPAGLRVLAVDDDPTCLMILAQMLKRCNYEVTMCTRATEALSKLREKKDSFDLVISDVYMPDMDGFKLLEQVGLEMDLPVIMTSSHGETSVVMKGVTHGACDYLIKPVRLEELRNIWQHVLRKKKVDASKDAEVSGSADEIEKHQQKRAGGGGGASDDNEYTSSVNDEGHNWKMTKRRKDDEENDQENEDNSTIKKQRVVWSVELHQQFVGAVNRLGIDKAVPKKILELMGVQGLTRENVASHLQKYRLYLRRLSTVQPPTPATSVPSYGASPEPLFGSTYNGMGPLGQLPHASLLPGGLMNNRPVANMVDTSVLMHSQAPFYGNSKVVPSSLMNIPPRGLDVDGQISPRTDDVSGLVLPQPFANNGILGRANGSGANSFHQPNCFAPRPNTNSGANLCTGQGGMNGGYHHRPLVGGGGHAPPPFYNSVSSGILDNSSNKLNTMTTSFGDLTGGLQHQHQQQSRGYAPKMPSLGMQSHLQLQQQQQQQQQHQHQHQPQQQPHESFHHLQPGSQDGFLGGSVLMNGSQHQPTRFAVEAAAANSGTRGSYGGFGLDDSTAESNFPVKVEGGGGGGGGGGLEGGSESVGGANNQDDLFSIFFKQVS